jgi:hypothetical protein
MGDDERRSAPDKRKTSAAAADEQRKLSPLYGRAWEILTPPKRQEPETDE